MLTSEPISFWEPSILSLFSRTGVEDFQKDDNIIRQSFTNNERDFPIDKKQFISLSTVRFSSGLGVAMVSTFIGIYSDIFSLSGVQVGLVGVAYSLVQLLILYPVGRYADLGHRKVLLLSGLVIGVPTYLLFWRVGGFGSLFGSRLLQGFSIALTTAVGLSFISIRSKEANRGRNLGTYNSLRAAGQTIGALGGGFLVARFGFGVPYMILASLYALSFAAILFVVPEESVESREGRSGGGLHLSELLAGVQFRIQIGFELFFAFAKAIIIVFIPVYAYAVIGLTEGQLGAVVAARYLMFALGQGPAGKLSDIIGRAPLVVGGGTLFAIAAFVLPYQKSFWGLLLVAALIGIGDSIRVPASWGIFADQGINTGPATSFSFRMLAWRPGLIAGPLLGGFIKDLMGIANTFYAAAAAVTVALIGYIVSHLLHGEKISL
ncbi:MAG: MFS transporter [Candidatus Bipolaricaulota bacterium]